MRKEIDGYIADRLQEALWREILHLVNDGIATTGEIDDAIRYGPGIRWAFMGTNLIYHLAGGEGGMRHMLEQFGPALDLPWTNHKAPKLTQELIERMVEGTAAQAKGWSIKDLERFRDDCLIRVLEAVEEGASGRRRQGAGMKGCRSRCRRSDEHAVSEPCTAQRLANLRRLLKPRHVAFVGGKGLAAPIKVCLASGFPGKIWPVHPDLSGDRRASRCYPSIEALPESPDAILHCGAARTYHRDRAGRWLARDAGGASAMRPAMPRWAARASRCRRQLVEPRPVISRWWGRIAMASSTTSTASSCSPQAPGGARAERGAAFISQSGNIALTLTMNERSVPFSYVISAGNQAVMRIADYIEVLADDPRVTAIGLYIEGLADIPAFAARGAQGDRRRASRSSPSRSAARSSAPSWR